MAVTGDTKNLDDKVKPNQIQYNLHGETAKISALSFKNWTNMNT